MLEAVLKNLKLNPSDILDIISKEVESAVSSTQQKFISGQIKIADRYRTAIDTTEEHLKVLNINITEDLGKIIKDKVEDNVFKLKTPNENIQLQQKIATIRSTVQASQGTATQTV